VDRDVTGDAFFPPFENEFHLAAELARTPEFVIRHYMRAPIRPPARRVE